MDNTLFHLRNLRIEISFKSYDEMRSILSFYESINIYNINIPCKNNLKKDFLLNSIKIAREEFPKIDIIPHFSILHEFRRNSLNTKNSFINFLKLVKSFGCKEVLLVSGSQKRSTLDSLLALDLIKNNLFFHNNYFFIGVAFNPYLPDHLFQEELLKIEEKLKSGIVNSIWIQFGTDYALLETRIKLLKDVMDSTLKNNSKISKIILYGSILIPSKQFLARFRYRPWKGVYCCPEFLKSVEVANTVIVKLLKTYKSYRIFPIIETDTSNIKKLNSLKMFFNF